MIYKVPSNLNYSMILLFYDSFLPNQKILRLSTSSIIFEEKKKTKLQPLSLSAISPCPAK